MGSSSSRRTDIAPPASPGCCGTGTRARNPSCRMSTWFTIGAPVAAKHSTRQAAEERRAPPTRRCASTACRAGTSPAPAAQPIAPRVPLASQAASRRPTTTTSNPLPMGPPITWQAGISAARTDATEPNSGGQSSSHTGCTKPHGMHGRWRWRGILAYLIGFAAMTPFFNAGTLPEGPAAKGTGRGGRLVPPIAATSGQARENAVAREQAPRSGQPPRGAVARRRCSACVRQPFAVQFIGELV